MSTSVLDSLVLEYMTSEGLIDFTDEALQQREIDEVSARFYHPRLDIQAPSRNAAMFPPKCSHREGPRSPSSLLTGL